MRIQVLGLCVSVMMGISVPGFCEWTPLQVQMHPYVIVPPAADVAGLSLNILGVSGHVWGAQISGVAFTGSVYGLQLGGYNAVGKSMYGIQTGVVNRANNMHGLQFGLYNRSSYLSGIQIGLFNYCESTLKGVQIGFANIGGANALLPYSIGINLGF